ncbi:MAG: carbohydrate-binding domain-containing protein [Oscillospiraceae bacterium]|nr:carbohydrate-binding domain-containing protein [Oscillospiraceae bacterium]MBP1574380.1 carbohydrate-binding domain-containing protein [Oscillospiraceae bacterium]
MKKTLFQAISVLLVLALTACGVNVPAERENPENPEISENQEAGEENKTSEPEKQNDNKTRKEVSAEGFENAVKIVLSENGVTVDGKKAEESDCVTLGGEIIYYRDLEKYPSGNEYGEGEAKDKHTEDEAAEHALVTITKPGEYFVTGELKGQLAVDLGENAKTDPKAKVTLIFGGADITCEIAPAVIFYNVYECGNSAEPSKDVDTSKAGANVVVADGSVSNINGANVAKIYKDNGKEEKLHKYDAALYSKMTMNIGGGSEGSGIINVNAENEGVGTEMHLTVNGGIINIDSKDDGINTNEDGVSVTTINGGKITIKGGLGTEGDGIDSNGWLVINGGELYSSGNGRSADGGIDSDNGIYINGGKVFALGSRNDGVSKDSKQLFASLTFATEINPESNIEFLDSEGNGIKNKNDRVFRNLIISDESFAEGKEFILCVNGVLQEYKNKFDMSGNFGKEIWDAIGFEQILPENFGEKQNRYEVPEELEKWLESEEDMPEDIRSWINSMTEISGKFGKEFGYFGGFVQEDEPKDPPENGKPDSVELSESEEDKTVFVISKEEMGFSGIVDSEKATGKETVEFTVNGMNGIEDIFIGDLPGIKSIECSRKVPEEQIQLTLIYSGRDESINVSRVCMLSEGYEKVNSLFKDLEPGNYRLIVEVTEENEQYKGIQYFAFNVVD